MQNGNVDILQTLTGLGLSVLHNSKAATLRRVSYYEVHFSFYKRVSRDLFLGQSLLSDLHCRWSSGIKGSVVLKRVQNSALRGQSESGKNKLL